MAADEDVAAGLLNWINSLEVAEPVKTVNELSNGEVLWKVLQHVENLAFPGSLPEDPIRIDPQSRESWISRWTNLKHIYDALSIFLVEECGQILPIFKTENSARKSDPDLKALAQHASLPDAILLVKLCVVSASLCTERLAFLTNMQYLTIGTQKILMETLQDLEEHQNDVEHYDVADEEEQDHFLANTDPPRHMSIPYQNTPQQNDLQQVETDLAFEERLAKILADNQRIAHEKRDIQRSFDDLSSRYNDLQERYERGQDELNGTNNRLNAILSGRNTGTSLNASQEAKQEALIATLESKVADTDVEIEELRKTNEVLRLRADRAQKLQDDYDEVKIERDKLARKANTAEKYRQKLESYQDMEKENSQLKTKITDLQAQLRQSDSRTATSSDLQREVDEYRRLLPGLEQGRHELNEMKKRLEFDYHLLQARHNESEEQVRRSREEIEYLQGRLRDYDDGIEPRSHSQNEQDDHEGSGITLEQEEADFTAAEARLAEALVNQTIDRADSSKNMSVDKLLTDENGVSEDELRAIMAAMRAQMHAGTVTERESGMRIQKRLVVMLEKLRSRCLNLTETVIQQKELMAQSKLQASTATEQSTKIEKSPAADEQADDSNPRFELEQQLEDQDTLIENLKREIKLISSAWYEQNQRLATLGTGGGRGAVALMRLKGSAGIEEPRSFLGRQRKLLSRSFVDTEPNSAPHQR